MIRYTPILTLFPYTTLFRSGFSSAKLIKSRKNPGTFSASYCCARSEEHTSELQSRFDLVCRLLLEKKNNKLSVVENMNKKHSSSTTAWREHGVACRPRARST